MLLQTGGQELSGSIQLSAAALQVRQGRKNPRPRILRSLRLEARDLCLEIAAGVRHRCSFPFGCAA